MTDGSLDLMSQPGQWVSFRFSERFCLKDQDRVTEKPTLRWPQNLYMHVHVRMYVCKHALEHIHTHMR